MYEHLHSEYVQELTNSQDKEHTDKRNNASLAVFLYLRFEARSILVFVV